MPKIFVNCPDGTFSATAKHELAADLTTIALHAENLPDTAYIRSTVWIYINEYPEANVYHGGQSGGTKVISLEVNAFKGGLGHEAKKILIEKFTASICQYAGIKKDTVAPVYILIRDIKASDWGYLVKQLRLTMCATPLQAQNLYSEDL